ncbi:hypothetical protein MMC08_001398, partial [Hypocenomyce scalaris]|nr:hypothetical protein [Hypocenomyce scalaris]
ENGTAKEWLKHSVSITLVCAAGAAGWAIAWRAGVWKPTPEEDNGNNGTAPMALGAQVLGYLSALAYLGLVSYLVASLSILHIAKTIVVTVLGYLRSSKTTASVHAKISFELFRVGLSLLFFILSLLGNATYGGGILFHSTAKRYFLTNLPWLIGSLGTMGEDILIFIQFHLYATNDAASSSAIV